MTAIIVIGSIIAFFLIIALIRVGVVLTYNAGSFSASMRIAFFSLRLYPQKEKKARAEKEEKHIKEKKKKEKPKPERKYGREQIMEIIRCALDAAGRFRRGLTIKELTVHMKIGNEDPSKSGTMYGAVSAGFGLILPFLENNFRIKKRDIRVNVDFSSFITEIDFKIAISVAIGTLVRIAFAFGWRLMRIVMKSKKSVPEPEGASVQTGAA